MVGIRWLKEKSLNPNRNGNCILVILKGKKGKEERKNNVKHTNLHSSPTLKLLNNAWLDYVDRIKSHQSYIVVTKTTILFLLLQNLVDNVVSIVMKMTVSLVWQRTP